MKLENAIMLSKTGSLGDSCATIGPEYSNQIDHALTEHCRTKFLDMVIALDELCEWYKDTHNEPMWERARVILKDAKEVKNCDI